MTDEVPAQNPIKFISCGTNILLVAPHGHDKDDENTGELVRLIAQQTGCYAIINEIYRKPKEPNNDATANKQNKRVNLNRKNQVTTHLEKEFLDPLIKYKDEIIEKFGNVFLLWIHGADDANVPKDVKVIVGYGQGDTDKRHTAEIDTINALIKGLNKNGLTTVKADPAESRFCARDINNMNQFFRLKGVSLDVLQSVQLEFRKQNCRDTDANIESTARDIANAISALVPSQVDADKEDAPVQEKSLVKRMANAKTVDNIVEIEDPIVEEAYEYIKGVSIKKFQETMLEIGQYLIGRFYDGDHNKAKSKPFTHNKSLKRLYEKLETETSGNLPKKSWLYNSINLAIAENDFGKDSIYGKLSQSHKVLLAGQKKLDKKKKINLMERAVDGKWTVVRLQHEIKQEKSDKETPKIDIFNLPHTEVLMKQSPKILNQLKGRVEVLIQTSTDTLKIAKLAEKRIKGAIESQEPSPAKLRKAVENNEWTVSRNNVNFQTGCSNDCVYCYGRFMFHAEKLKKEAEAQGQEFHWGEIRIRQNDIDKNYGLKDGRVGFPTSHDITPENLADYLTVLGKLLLAGNKILIITKPVLECIQGICNASAFFKNKILFRFTITAKSSDILKFWEPNAPSYEHRFECLKYAHDAGFQTSVSIEPMLEYPRAQEMVDEMLPYITDAVWFGKMNHIKSFDNPGDDLKAELEKVEAGHSDDNIKALYEIYGDNPKIKWKLAYKDVLGIPLPPAAGMDI